MVRVMVGDMPALVSCENDDRGFGSGPGKPGQHVISAPKEAASHPPPVSEASPGAIVADSDPGPAGEPEEERSAPPPPIAEPEPGRA